jgi:diguanylate cyclase (GGDEF)-like protein
LIKTYFSTLTGRFTLSAFLMQLVMAPLLFGGVFYLVESNYRNNFVDQVRNDALILASLSESHSEGQNENSLHFQQKIIDDAVANGRLSAAQIVDEKNKVLHSWGKNPSLMNRDEDFFFGQHDDTVFNIIVPRYDLEGNVRGELFLSYDEQPTLEQIALAYRYGIYLSFIYIGITFLLTMLLGRQVTNPIQQLREASYDISMGQYEKPLHVKTGIQEIQKLARTLEQMRSELVRKNIEMEYQATHDTLTGLPNRLLLRYRIDQSMPDDDQNQSTMSLLLIDLDRFKEINDTLGHSAGDEVLKIMAERLQSCVRQSDTAARLGGDEFAVILPATDSEKAVKIARHVSECLRESFTVEDHKLQVGASIGVAIYPEHGKSFKDVLHCADLAMYASKRRGETVLYSKQLDIDNKLNNHIANN